MFKKLIALAALLFVSSAAIAETIVLPGMLEPGRIIRDNIGIPHVQASNNHDLFMMQGYIHAEDRIFQMDRQRRQASGTLSEVFGPSFLATDVQLRAFGLRRAAELSWDILSEDAKEAVSAYAEGVNAWLATNPPPPEYGFLAVSEIEPWTAIDSVAIANLIAFGLSFDLDVGRTEDFAAYLQTLGQQGFVLFTQDVFRHQPFDCASTVPDAAGKYPFIPVPDDFADPRCIEPASMANMVSQKPRAAASFGKSSYDLAGMKALTARIRGNFQQSKMLSDILDTENFTGSNEWGVTGALGANGFPLGANDPHLALDAPSTFYPIHLGGDGINVFGGSFPGAPAVILGHNFKFAWGATVNPMDVTDAFLELVQFDPQSGLPAATIFQGQPEPIQVIPEEFYALVRGEGLVLVPPGPCELPGCSATIPPATFVVPRRNGGPIIEILTDMADPETGLVPAVSIQYTGFGPTRTIEAFLTWNKGRYLSDFLEGLSLFDFGSQNFLYTDKSGRVGHFTSAEMPIRSDLHQGFVAPGSVPGFFPEGVPIPPWFIRDGTSGAHEWLPAINMYENQALPYEILGPKEMPQVMNPPAGFYVNANNDPAGTTLDNNPLNQLRTNGQGIFYLNPGYDGFRGGTATLLLRETIDANGQVTLEDMKRIQADTSLIDARYFVPWILQAWENASGEGASPELAALAADERLAEAAGRLAEWDYTTPTGIQEGYDYGDDPDALPEPTEDEIAKSVSATIYSVWRGQAIRAIVDATLDDLGLPGPGSAQALTSLRALLDFFPLRQGFGASGIDFFAVEGVEDRADARDIKILGALQATLDLLAGPNFAPVFQLSTNQDDYRWGLLHRITFDHTFLPWYSLPSDTGIVGQLPGYATDGGFGVLDASSHSARADEWDEFGFGSGPSRRFVIESVNGADSVAESIWPGGTSGVPVPGNPFYSNLLPTWLVNDTVPTSLRFSEASQNAYDFIRFVPAE
jgi:penicillin amidase